MDPAESLLSGRDSSNEDKIFYTKTYSLEHEKTSESFISYSSTSKESLTNSRFTATTTRIPLSRSSAATFTSSSAENIKNFTTKSSHELQKQYRSTERATTKNNGDTTSLTDDFPRPISFLPDEEGLIANNEGSGETIPEKITSSSESVELSPKSKTTSAELNDGKKLILLFVSFEIFQYYK